MYRGYLGEHFRASTGPLYDARELKMVEEYLTAQGLTATEDNRILGARIYTRPDGADKQSAVIYLDTLGCRPMLSGTMTLDLPNARAQCTTVWSLARQIRIDNTKNPVLRAIRRVLPF